MLNNAKLTIKIKRNFQGEERNIFMITTLFQLIGAVEAKDKLKTKNNILVFLFYGNNNLDESQLLKFLHLFDYDKLIIYNQGNISGILQATKSTINLVKTLKGDTYINIFLGFFSANIRRITANLTYKNLFLLDDGVYTIAIHNELYSSNIENFKKLILPFSEKKKNTNLKKLRFYIFHNIRKTYLFFNGFKNDMNNLNLNFFTIFKLSKMKNEIIINHDFDYLKKVCSPYVPVYNTEYKVYFLGQPLQRSLLMSNEEYIIYINSIATIYKNRNMDFIYVKHRAEEESIITTLRGMEIKILIIQEPFEIYCLENNINLKAISSFMSTALFSMRRIFPTLKIEAFKPHIKGDIVNNVNLLYDMMKQEQIYIFEWNNKNKLFELLTNEKSKV